MTLASDANRALSIQTSQDGTFHVEATESEAGRTENLEMPAAAVRLTLDGARHEALDELVCQAQELGLGY
jgi:hypothetical protein